MERWLAAPAANVTPAPLTCMRTYSEPAGRARRSRMDRSLRQLSTTGCSDGSVTRWCRRWRGRWDRARSVIGNARAHRRSPGRKRHPVRRSNRRLAAYTGLQRSGCANGPSDGGAVGPSDVDGGVAGRDADSHPRRRCTALSQIRSPGFRRRHRGLCLCPCATTCPVRVCRRPCPCPAYDRLCDCHRRRRGRGPPAAGPGARMMPCKAGRLSYIEPRPCRSGSTRTENPWPCPSS
jgi:hypothetical protein